MKKHPCDGKPRVCPGQCNPRNQLGRGAADRRVEILPYRQENTLNRNVYNRHEYALFSPKTEADCLRPDSPGLTPEEREFVEALTRRVRAKKRHRGQDCLLRRLAVFVLFFLIHGCIAILAQNYQQYQTFIATQFCGFITIMFWDDSDD